MQVFFKERQDPNIPQKKVGKNQTNVDEDQSQSIHSIKLEKVYDDFKRLHEHITETFLNEINEYERYKKLVENPDSATKNENEFKQRGISMNYDSNDNQYRDQSAFSNNTFLSNQPGQIEFDEGVK